MPVYVFECKDCKKRFEVSGGFEISLQLFQCPYCKSNNVKKVFLPTTVIYKGSGFYSNDKNN